MSEQNRPLLIGVDGGGTGCRAAIATGPAHILAQAEAGPANATTGIREAIANTRKAIELAANMAGIETDALKHCIAHVGLAGVISDQISKQISAALGIPSCVVTDDRPTTVIGALAANDGYLLGIGTGTIAASSKAGRLRYVNGWGLQLSDHASGGWLGRGLLERTLQSYDGTLSDSPLTQKVLARFNGSVTEIVAFSADAAPSDYAKFAPEIIQAAANDDANAKALMRNGAEYLLRALDALGFEQGNRLCLTGGVGPHYETYLAQRYRENIFQPLGTPLTGAIILAAQRAGIASGRNE